MSETLGLWLRSLGRPGGGGGRMHDGRRNNETSQCMNTFRMPSESLLAYFRHIQFMLRPWFRCRIRLRKPPNRKLLIAPVESRV